MSKQLVSGKHRLRNTYWSLVGAASATILSVQPVMAETIWDRFSTSWLKRVVATWIILNTLGFIVAYLQPLIAGGQYTG